MLLIQVYHTETEQTGDTGTLQSLGLFIEQLEMLLRHTVCLDVSAVMDTATGHYLHGKWKL